MPSTKRVWQRSAEEGARVVRTTERPVQMRCDQALGAQTMLDTETELLLAASFCRQCLQQACENAREIGAHTRGAQGSMPVLCANGHPSRGREAVWKAMDVHFATAWVCRVLGQHRARERCVVGGTCLHRILRPRQGIIAECIVNSQESPHVTNSAFLPRSRFCRPAHVLLWHSTDAQAKSRQSARYNTSIAGS